jgi:signal transduction histidine kinase
VASRSERALRGGLALALVLLLALGTRLAWLGNVDEQAAERYALLLETLHSLDAELSAETLKARSGLVAHYDGLVRSEKNFDALQHRLLHIPSFVSDAQRHELLAQLAAAEATTLARFQLVERFKSENAVLRNSLLFLRTAASVLDAYPGRTADERTFREDASALVRDVLLLRLSQDRTVLERVSRSLATLEHYVDGLPSTQREQLAPVLSHARAVREHAPSVDALVHQIVDRPVFVHASAGQVGTTTDAARATAHFDAQPLIASYARMQHQALARERQSTTVFLSMLWLGGALTALTIIVRMRRSAAALRGTRDQLEAALGALQVEQTKQRELSELKTRFVAMTSHEFRTPLSTIMSSSELLDAYDARWSRDKKAQHFERIRSAVLHMTHMLDGILTIGRSDAGKLEFKPGPVDLARFCVETAESAEKALTSAHELCVEAPEAAPSVVADEALLRQVGDNLLSNAIKYSPRGGRVEFRVAQEGDDVVIAVRDQGIGIPARDRERLFEVFHRGANVGTVAGSGLGLSIVKRAVDLHGGSVHVESELGVGTRFVVRMRCEGSAA